MSRILSTALWLLAALVVLFAVAACGPGDAATERDRHEAVTDGRAEFTLGDTRFRIPRKYFKGVAHAAGGRSESANLWALLPNFEGYDPAVNRDEFIGVWGYGRRIYIDLYPRPRLITVPQIVTRMHASPAGPLAGRAGHPDGLVYGLEYYRGGGNSYVWETRYLYRENGIPVLLLKCGGSRKKPDSGGCQGSSDYSPSIAVHFSFDLKYLPQWREVWQGVNALLRGELDCCTRQPPTKPR